MNSMISVETETGILYKKPEDAVNGSYVYYDKPEGDYVESGITQLYENRTPGNGNIKAGLSETANEIESAGFL